MSEHLNIAFNKKLDIIKEVCKCPIDHIFMYFPVIAEDGQTYDLYSLYKYLGKFTKRSPFDRNVNISLEGCKLNHYLKSLIEKLFENNFLDADSIDDLNTRKVEFEVEREKLFSVNEFKLAAILGCYKSQMKLTNEIYVSEDSFRNIIMNNSDAEYLFANKLEGSYRINMIHGIVLKETISEKLFISSARKGNDKAICKLAFNMDGYNCVENFPEDNLIINVPNKFIKLFGKDRINIEIKEFLKITRFNRINDDYKKKYEDFIKIKKENNYKLADLYFYGIGIRLNHFKAKKLYQLCAEKGCKYSQEKLKLIGNFGNLKRECKQRDMKY